MRATTRLTRRGFGIMALGVLTAGCSSRPVNGDSSAQAMAEGTGKQFAGTPVEPAPSRPALVLPDTQGQEFDLRNRPKSEVTVVFFGYTHCPDVCPTTMADLAQARNSLPPDVRQDLQVVFVTEDPERDKPPIVREWLDRFDPDFIGLVGGTPQTKQVLEELYLPTTQRIEEPETSVVHPDDEHEHPGDYGLEHASIIYAFAPGDRVLIYTGGFTPEQYADDFAALVNHGER